MSAKLTHSDWLFCSSNGENYKDLQFAVKEDKENQQIFIFETLKEKYLGIFLF